MIDVKDLHLTYPKNTQETIRGIDFSISRGEIFGFLGPSGAGKTTTQKIIIGILRGYGGHVVVNGKELKERGSDCYERIGVAFELPNLYSGKTVSPKSLLAIVGLEEDGNRRVSEFSKGMKMRLNFCRAFLNNPDIIFLDEPTTGLDSVNARKIKDFILESLFVTPLAKTGYLAYRILSPAALSFFFSFVVLILIGLALSHRHFTDLLGFPGFSRKLPAGRRLCSQSCVRIYCSRLVCFPASESVQSQDGGWIRRCRSGP
jgi:energy-coupling factor transporter ATP-binding protein EcfA2